MANKPLKSIKFPGLNDTYTVPQVDDTLATTGAAADAKKVGDEINDIKADLNNFSGVLEIGYSEKDVILSSGTYTGFDGEVIQTGVDAKWRKTSFSVTRGKSYKITFTVMGYASGPLSYIYMCDENDVILSRVLEKYSASATITEVITPSENVSKIFVRAYYAVSEPVLQVEESKTVFDSIKTDFDSIKTDLNNFSGAIETEYSKKSVVTNGSPWEVGTINAATGAVQSSTTRIRSNKLYHPLSAEVLTGYKMRIFAYDDGSFVGAWTGKTFIKTEDGSTWLDGKINISAIGNNYQYIIVVRKDDSGTMTRADHTNLIVDYLASDDFIHWEQGTRRSKDGVIIASTNRIRMESVFREGSILKAKTNKDYAFIVYAWENSTQEYAGIWTGNGYAAQKDGYFVQEFEFDYGNYYYRLILKRIDDADISASEAENVVLLYADDPINKIEYDEYNTGFSSDKNIYKNQLVFTLGYMYVRRDGDMFHLSVDGGRTYSKSIGIPTGFTHTFGTLKNVYVFKNGTLLVCDHQYAYYTDDWITWHESACLDRNGTAYVPTQYNTFTNTNRIPRVFVDGVEVYVFGNYNIDDENNNRILIWYTIDNGHTLKVAYEFNVEGAMSIRHVHGMTYCEKQNNFWIYTGDSSTQSKLIKGTYDIVNDSWTFTQVAQGLDFKWASLVIRGDEFYYCHDLTPGDIVKAKVGDEDDISKHHVILSNLPNDPIGLFIGQKSGEILVTLSMYRTGTSPSSNTAQYDSKRMWYSGDGVNFVEINGNEFVELTNNMNNSFYMFCGPNSMGDIICGYEKSSAGGGAFKDRDFLPSISLTDMIKCLGFDCNFK